MEGRLAAAGKPMALSPVIPSAASPEDGQGEHSGLLVRWAVDGLTEIATIESYLIVCTKDHDARKRFRQDHD